MITRHNCFYSINSWGSIQGNLMHSGPKFRYWKLSLLLIDKICSLWITNILPLAEWASYTVSSLSFLLFLWEAGSQSESWHWDFFCSPLPYSECVDLNWTHLYYIRVCLKWFMLNFSSVSLSVALKWFNFQSLSLLTFESFKDRDVFFIFVFPVTKILIAKYTIDPYLMLIGLN